MVGCILFSALFAVDVPLPNTSYKHNTLPNGLTYYVKKNSFPENRASVRLFVKAGSLHEEENQRGLAHFLEHMLFRGSENFEDWEVINFLESIGAQFGPDTNAYTSFDRTVYMLELPLEKEGVLDKAIHICSEWASKASIKDELVEKERPVVADEYNINMKQSSTRQFKKIFDTFLSDSRYNIRWPIGLKDIILGCDPQVIRDFYKKWYRADRMAVVAVGDFDEDEVEAMIVKYFSSMEKPTEELVEPDTSLNLSEDSQFEVFQDDEQMFNIGMLWSLIDNDKEKEGKTKELTLKGTKKDIFEEVFERVFEQRLNKMAKTHPAPFTAHFPMNFDIDRLGIRGLGFIPYEDRPYEGMTSIIREMVRLFTFGPSKHEFVDVLNSLKVEAENKLANTHRITHAALANQLSDHFAAKSAIYLEEDYLNFKLGVYDELTKEEMLDWLNENNFEPFKHIVFQVADHSFIDKASIESAIESWMKEEVVDKEEMIIEDFELNKKSFVEDLQYAKVFDEELGFTKITLNNGMKVVLQPSELEKKQVTLQFFAEGGKTLLAEDFFPSTSFAAEYLVESGIGNLCGTQFDSFLKKMNISAYFGIGLNERYFTFSGTNDKLEMMLNLSAAGFTERLRDENVWNGIIDRHTELYKNLENSPYYYFSVFVSNHYYKNHPMYRQYKPWEAKEENAVAILNQLFSDPSQFTLLVIGDFAVDDVITQIVELFSSQEAEKADVVAAFPENISHEKSDDITVFRGAESHCMNYMFYGGEFTYDHKLDMSMTYAAFDHIVSHRLLEKLRKEMGDTYSVRLSSNFPYAPNLDEMMISINFSCEPEKADNMKSFAREVLDNFLKKGVTDDEIATAKEILLERERVSYLSNVGLLRAHQASNMYDVDVHNLVDYVSKIERQVTKERIEGYAKAAFSENRHLMSYTIKPDTHQE